MTFWVSASSRGVVRNLACPIIGLAMAACGLAGVAKATALTPTTGSVKGRAYTVLSSTWPGVVDLYPHYVPAPVTGLDGSIYFVAGTRLYRLAPTTAKPIPVHAYDGPKDPWRMTAGLAPAAGGVFLADDKSSRILMIDRSGQESVVAGVENPLALGPSGDGGAARQARLCLPGPIARLRGGGLVFVDAHGGMVREVNGGKISTVAETAGYRQRPPGASAQGDSCVDWTTRAGATGDAITDLATTARGEIQVLLQNVVSHRYRTAFVTSSAIGPTQTRLGTDPWLGGAADGGVYIRGRRGVLHRPRSGGPSRVALGYAFPPADARARVLIDRDGEKTMGWMPGKYFYTSMERVTEAPDGGLLALGALEDSLLLKDGFFEPRIVYVAPARPQRMAVAISARRGRANDAGYDAQVKTTMASSVRVTVLHGGRSIATARTRSVPGKWTRVAVAHAFRPGTYSIHVVATTDAGHVSMDGIRVILGGTLSDKLARWTTNPVRDCSGEGACTPSSLVACHRFRARRVDCRWQGRPHDCSQAAAALGADGLVRLRPYGCRRSEPRFPSRPAYTSSAFVVAPKQTFR